jgi:hypothetical protein
MENVIIEFQPGNLVLVGYCQSLGILKLELS